MAKEKENNGSKELGILTVNLKRANVECSLKAEELEKSNFQLQHLQSEFSLAQTQLTELECTKDENLTLKKSLIGLENEIKVEFIHKVRLKINYSMNLKYR